MTRKVVELLAALVSLPVGRTACLSKRRVYGRPRVEELEPRITPTIPFFDGTFNNTDWTAFKFPNAVPGSAFTSGQVTAGGDPGAYQAITRTWTGPGGISVGELRNGAVYDPASNGPITDISFSLDAISFKDTSGIDFVPLLMQNGNYYGTGITPLSYVFQGGGWQLIESQDLPASAFFSSSGPEHPDFSSKGSPIQFGYISGNGTASSLTITTICGVDNWSITVNTMPVANGQSVTMGENTTKGLTLTGIAYGDPFTFQIATNPAHGTLTGFNANTGAVTYTPNANYTGSDSFAFTMTDTANGLVSPAATVSLMVLPPPTANAQSVTTQQNQARSITLTGSAPNGDAFTFQVVNTPANGALSGTAPNLIYTPNTNYTGPDSFTFTVTDTTTSLTSAPAADSLTVTPTSASYTYRWNGTVSSDWFNPANWTDVKDATHHAAPGQNDTAVITGGPIDVILTANATVGNLVMNTGFLTLDANLTDLGTLYQDEGFVAFGSDADQLLIAGDVTHNGGFLSSFNAVTRRGTVVLDGTAAQTVTDKSNPNHPLGWNLVIANASAAGVTIASGSTVIVGNNVAVNAGALLTLAGSATLTAGGNFTDSGTVNLAVSAPGNATAPLTVGGKLTLNAGSVLNLSMGAPAAGVTYLFIQYGSLLDNGAQFNFFGQGGFTPTKHEYATTLTVTLT
jgi:hypothetical protein